MMGSDLDLYLLHEILEFARPFKDWTIRRVWPNAQEIDDLHAWGVDGIIGYITSSEVAARILAHKFPTVNVSGVGAIKGLTTVTTDNLMVGQMAADYLVSCDSASFAFVGQEYPNPPEPLYARQRRQGFATRLGELGHSTSYSEFLNLE